MAAKKSSKKRSTKKASSKPATSTSCAGSCGSWGKKDSGCFYFLGFLGAFIYYMSIATGFWSVVLGFVKALVWPAMVVMHILGL